MKIKATFQNKDGQKVKILCKNNTHFLRETKDQTDGGWALVKMEIEGHDIITMSIPGSGWVVFDRDRNESLSEILPDRQTAIKEKNRILVNRATQ